MRPSAFCEWKMSFPGLDRQTEKGPPMSEHSLLELVGLIEEARRQKKWLWCAYQDLWFSPDDLAAENAAGRFRWGVVNWKLRDPRERLAEARGRTDRAQAEERRIADEIAKL